MDLQGGIGIMAELLNLRTCVSSAPRLLITAYLFICSYNKPITLASPYPICAKLIHLPIPNPTEMASETSPPSSRATGSCLCSAITYTLTSPALTSIMCHCKNCRKASGGPFMTNCIFPKSALIITRGTEALRTYDDSDNLSGRTISRSFCGICGSWLFVESNAKAGIVAVASGTVDEGVEDEVLAPKVEAFCAEKRMWMEEREGVDRRDLI